MGAFGLKGTSVMLAKIVSRVTGNATFPKIVFNRSSIVRLGSCRAVPIVTAPRCFWVKNKGKPMM